MKTSKKTVVSMPIVNHGVAAVDVGSRSHWVAVGQEPKNDVREFGIYTKDFQDIITWFKERSIKSVVMEATGSYWQTLYSALEAAGFELLLSSSKTIKNPEGKTDKKDARWLQKLHSLGMLKGSFLPEASILKLRQYARHRSSLSVERSRQVNRMQKVMQLMNVRLEVAVSDITGVSGMKIMNAILEGERDAHKLASLASHLVKKSREEIASALLGNWREELLFELQNLMDAYTFYTEKIDSVDKQIELQLEGMKPNDNDFEEGKIKRKPKQKGQPKFDIAKLSYQYYGVDLASIDGISDNVILTVISEIGKDIYKFAKAKSFSNWLRLSPQNKITGGKVISSHTPKGKNIVAVALRNAANTIGNRKEGSLKAFFSRIAYKKGRGAAITATARKLAVIIWNMITKKQEYSPIEEKLYDQKIKSNVINNINKKMKRLGISVNELLFDIKSMEINSLIDNFNQSKLTHSPGLS